MTDSKRLIVFIYGSNFYFSLKKTFSTSKIDLKKFIDFLLADYNVSFKKTKSYHLNKICNYTLKIDYINNFIL